ncbi:MAG: acyltransferase family protein, partial [Planctomycetota bacterium]
MKDTDKQIFSLGYIRELDGIRGVSILAVMLFHAGAPFLKGGFIGVDIFFVLSGFLITTLLLKEYDQNKHLNLKNFYLRRVLRLAPALILFLLVLSIYSIILLDEVRVKYNLIDSLFALFYMSNWMHALQIHPPNLLRHTWSLSIEEQFYIIWPLMLLFLLRIVCSRKKILLIVISLALFSWVLRVLLASYGASFYRLYYGLDTRADALLVGCALGVTLSSSLISGKFLYTLSKILKYIAPLSVFVLISIGYGLHWRSMHMFYWLFFGVEVLAAILILDVFISKSVILKAIFSNNLLVWIGSISYGLYLWH